MSKTILCSKAMLTACILSACLIKAESATRIVNNTSHNPSTIGTLPYWLLNADEGDTIDCSSIAGQQIILTSSLPAITKSYTIDGSGITIDGDNNYQAFQVASGTVAINNVKVQNALSKGGDGGDGYSGGGGAVGGGGALYIHGGVSVTLTASSLLNNIAQGGNGGAANSFMGNNGGGGGGGFGGGKGGNCLLHVTTGGGGGGHSNGGDGGSDSFKNGGDGVYFGGGGGGAGINSAGPGGSGGAASPTGAFTGGAESIGNGGGGAGDSEDGFAATGGGSSGVPGNGGNGIGADFLFGAGGGGGCASETGFPGGAGIGSAGGGGGANYAGGPGGILGGGGGGGSSTGGQGGFGAGGGGASTGGTGGGGFGAGGGNGGSDSNGNGGGGGGSGLGSAIFIQSNGLLTIIDAPEISGNIAIAGVGGSSTNDTDPGYIPAGDGAAMGHEIFMRQGSSLIFNISDTLVISNPIEGDSLTTPVDDSGSLIKTGMGILELNGANTYVGRTRVEQGILNLNGSILGNINVDSGATLSGNLTVNDSIYSSGTISPGNSIGTIFTTNLYSTGVYDVEVNSSGSSDQIIASGFAQISGSILVTPDDYAFKAPITYTIISTSTGVTGEFSSLISTVPSLKSLTYTPSTVELTYLPIDSLGLGENSNNTANCFGTLLVTPGSDTASINNALINLSFDALQNIFDQMGTASFSGLANVQETDAILVRSTHTKHLQEFCLNQKKHCGESSSFWIDGIGQWQKQKKHYGYRDTTVGGTFGVDYSHQNWIAGMALSSTYVSV